MKETSNHVLQNSVSSLRELIQIINEADWKLSHHGPFDDQTRGIQDTKERMKKGPLASTGAGDAPDLATNLLNAQPKPYEAPAPEMRQIHPADTSYAQDHPSSFIPPEDKVGDLSDLDKAPAYGAPQHGAAPKLTTQHPAGIPKTPGAKFDPAIQKLQYELRAKGYNIKADGILGPNTQQILDWEEFMKSNGADKSQYQQFAPDVNTQGDDYRDPTANTPEPEIPDIPEDPAARIAESVTFKQEDSLARLLQIAQWR